MAHQAAIARLVNREREFAMLLERLDATVREGHGAVVVVRGEAGIGKSRLLAALTDEAAVRYADAGLLTGYGQAMLNSLASDSFQAVRECLRSLTRSAERSGSRDTLHRLAESFRQHAPDWIESVPVIGHLLAAGVRTSRTVRESGRAPAEMESRLDQLIRFVEGLLHQGPLLLVLDDLHWADTATIDLLVTMALRVRGPLMLVMAYRPDNLGAGEQADAHPLKRAVFRLRRYRPDCRELDLEPLSRGHTELFVRQVAEHPVPGRVTARIVRLSGGNPLFAESLLRLGDRAAAASTPRQITAVLDERLSFLTAADQRLLETAALIGYSFEVDYLARLARRDLDDVYERLDVLLGEHGLVRPAEPRGEFDRYTLHHPLLAEVLRERGAANGPRWRRQHQRLLEIIDAEQPWDDELQVRAVAVAVAAGARERAWRLAVAASRRQFEIGAVSKARELAQVAADHAVGTAGALEAFGLLAECLSAEGNHVDATTACASAVTPAGTVPGDPHRERSVRLLWARSLRMTNRWDECRGLLEELVGDAAPGEALAEALILRAEIALCGPLQDTEECIRLCEAVAAMSRDPELRSRAHGHRGLAHLAAYDADSAEEWLIRAIEVAREKDHPYAEYEAVHWLSKKAMACLELDRAWRLLEELAHTSRRSGVASESPWHLRDSSRVLGLQGEAATAAAVFARYFDSGLTRAGGRALTTLACQLHELDDLYGRATGDAMLERLAEACDRHMIEPERRARLAGHIGTLADRPADWRPVPFAVTSMGVDQAEAEAADAIFRFDVPDLARLRSRLGHEG